MSILVGDDKIRFRGAPRYPHSHPWFTPFAIQARLPSIVLPTIFTKGFTPNTACVIGWGDYSEKGKKRRNQLDEETRLLWVQEVIHTPLLLSKKAWRRKEETFNCAGPSDDWEVTWTTSSDLSNLLDAQQPKFFNSRIHNLRMHWRN